MLPTLILVKIKEIKGLPLFPSSDRHAFNIFSVSEKNVSKVLQTLEMIAQGRASVFHPEQIPLA